jgi:hypothetical protein
MNDRAGDLVAAASAIDTQTLEAAKAAIAVSCREYLRWADLFSSRLETVKPSDLHKFARALSLTLLGHLPTRPGTCPFCIQYGHDKSCTGCGYAATHGRCDAETSAFCLFIEAFQELGRTIYQDTGELGCPAHEARQLLNLCIQASCDLSVQMQKDLPSASTLRLMELKATYLDAMIALLPGQLFSEEVQERRVLVRKTLLNYW